MLDFQAPQHIPRRYDISSASFRVRTLPAGMDILLYPKHIIYKILYVFIDISWKEIKGPGK